MTFRRIIQVGKEPAIRKEALAFSAEILVADDVIELRNMLQTVSPDLILFDYTVPRRSVIEYLESQKSPQKAKPIVILAGSVDTGAAEDAFIRKILKFTDTGKSPEGLVDGISTDNRGICYHDLRYFHPQCPKSVPMAGLSRAMAEALKMINLVAESSCNPVLVLGRTGTGKELAARAVHSIRQGDRSKFVAINCAALTANLLESELFGHAKGSFTGADREKIGLFELAGEGTVFLDEISEMPLDLQAKMLRVIQEKSFRKVGGVKDIPCKATIIASSNCDLQSLTAKGRFRSDLYYRLAVCPIVLSPLKSPDRREDIKLLSEYFLKTSDICPGKNEKISSLTPLALEALEKHDWPGNVRELKNVIDRAILLETTNKIGLSSLTLNMESCQTDAGKDNSGVTKDFSLERAERELIGRALREANWQKTKAACLLGITRATLYAKVKQYNIEQPARIGAKKEVFSLTSPVDCL
ncbi:MAG: sigma-54 dependent transcriptional regulator [Planctomycetota bacterium]